MYSNTISNKILNLLDKTWTFLLWDWAWTDTLFRNVANISITPNRAVYLFVSNLVIFPLIFIGKLLDLLCGFDRDYGLSIAHVKYYCGDLYRGEGYGPITKTFVFIGMWVGGALGFLAAATWSAPVLLTTLVTNIIGLAIVASSWVLELTLRAAFELGKVALFIPYRLVSAAWEGAKWLWNGCKACFNYIRDFRPAQAPLQSAPQSVVAAQPLLVPATATVVSVQEQKFAPEALKLQWYQDSVTFDEMVNPVSLPNCSHSFDKSTVDQLQTQPSTGLCKCPLCNQEFIKTHCHVNLVLKEALEDRRQLKESHQEEKIPSNSTLSTESKIPDSTAAAKNALGRAMLYHFFFASQNSAPKITETEKLEKIIKIWQMSKKSQ